MKQSQVIMTMQFSRKNDADLYDVYAPFALLLGSNQGKDTNSIAKTLEDIGSTMDKGKKYRITIEELE